NGPARLLLNQVGNRNHWLGLRVLGKSGRDMLGARVEIVITKDKVLWRRARTDGSYLSANDPRVVAGLGNAVRVDAVRVHWPDGSVTEHKNPVIDRYNLLKGGTR
ncbi:MAG TPA: ASPIC/UnbV domain-containing protein, partial [Pyrinomonadaceae bacterium]|nr:ASPIC/UnbV domain-containing protein [Pyrinomonadaceae bacterium]